jgi:hypothetical protein
MSSLAPGDPGKQPVQQLQHIVDRQDNAGHDKQCVEGPDGKLAPRLSGQPVGAGSFAALRLGLIWGGWLR